MVTIDKLEILKSLSEMAFIKNPVETLKKLNIDKNEFPVQKSLNVKQGEITYFEFEELGVTMIKTPFAIHLMSNEQFNELYDGRK